MPVGSGNRSNGGNRVRIRGKINAIVGVMSAVAIVIGGMALYVMSEYSAKLSAYEIASERAYKGERLNRFVTAVVMEARGIYGAPSTADAKKFADGLLKSLDSMDAVIADWAPLVPAAQKAGFDTMVARSAEFRTFRAETARLGTEVDPKAANEQGNNDANRANRKAYQAEIDAIVDTDKAELSVVKASLESFRLSMLLLVSAITGLGIIIGAAVGSYFARNHISGPILKVTETMKSVASGDFAVDVPFIGRADEIGEIAAAVEVFKQNGIAVGRMNAQETAMRAKSDDLQSSMSVVVSAAAAGDFSQRIDKDYQDDSLNHFAANINDLLASVDSGVSETRRVIASLADGDLTETMRTISMSDDGKFVAAPKRPHANSDPAS